MIDLPDGVDKDALDRPGAWVNFLRIADLDSWRVQVRDENTMTFDYANHRFVVQSTVMQRTRYWSIAYDRVDDPFEDGRGQLDASAGDASIMQNKLLGYLESITGDVVAMMDGPDGTPPYVIVHRSKDSPPVWFPNAKLAERAANYHTRQGLDAPDGPYRVWTMTATDYRERFADDADHDYDVDEVFPDG